MPIFDCDINFSFPQDPLSFPLALNVVQFVS